MNVEDYGPFAEVIAVATALLAVFSLLVVKAVGKVKNWTWLAGDPPLLVTVGARALAVVCIALTFVLINKMNYLLFGVGAFVIAALAIGLIVRFDWLRKIHTYSVPMLNADGTQAQGPDGKPSFQNLVIGTEDTMRPDAKKALAKARKEHGPISLTDYLSGSGGTNLNNPGANWSREELARISSNFTLILMGIVLATVLALYLAASVVQVHQSIPKASETATQQ